MRPFRVFAAAAFAIAGLFVFSTTLFATGSSEQSKNITFMTPPWGVPPDTAALKSFESSSGVKVQVISLPMDQLYSKVQIANSAGQVPADVIFLSEEAPSNIVAPGFVMPLNDFVKSDSSFKISDFQRTDFWTVKGKLYGIPSYVQMVMLDYNEAKLKQAGFDSPPTTWTQFAAEAKAIKAKGIDNYPVAFGAIDWSWYLIALSMGDPMFDSDLNPVFADQGSKAREAMALLFSFFKDGLITPSLLAETTPHSVFMGGTGVFHQSWQGANTLMNNPKVSKQAPNVRYMLLPDVGNTWSLDAALGISSKSKATKAAWEFIKWYVGDTNQLAIYKAFGLIPARTSLQDQLSSQGKIAGYKVIAEQAKHVHQLPRYATWWGPWTSKVTQLIREGLQGKMTANQVVDQAATQWKNLKAQYAK